MRSIDQEIKDFFTFPIRAFTLYERDKFGLSSLQTERYDYVAKEVYGRCLDVGCGRNNRFIKEFVNNNGVGIDVFEYEGLNKKNIVKDMTNLPFKDESFDTVTLIANINHIPKSIRKKELMDIYRVTKNGGQIIVTMGNPLVEILVHKVVWFYDKFFKTNVDVDSERGMKEGEEYFLTDKYIKSLLTKIGFKNIKRKYFITQWGLNHLFIGDKT
ncbi:MAG: methyltransferase domain-containing protein [Candidatus Shapirobacteria bacterium]